MKAALISSSCQPPDHEADAGDGNPGNGAFDGCLTAAASRPGEGTLHHPAAGQQLDPLGCIGALDDFDGPLAGLVERAAQLPSAITALGKDVARPRIGYRRRGEQTRRPGAVLIVTPEVEILPDRAARRKVLGQMAPLAASLKKREHALQNLPDIYRAPPATTLRGRDMASDQDPLRVGQIAPIPQTSPFVLRSIFLTPHPTPPSIAGVRDKITNDSNDPKSFQTGSKDLPGDAGLLKELEIKLMERMLGAELTAHPGYEEGKDGPPG